MIAQRMGGKLMKNNMLRGAVAAMAVSLTAPVLADPADDTLVINGDIEIVTHTSKAPSYIEGLKEQYSGWHFRNDGTRDMERDDFDNPAMLAVEAAREVWTTVDGSEGKSCATCHEAAETLAGVKAVYPKWSESGGEMRTLQMQIDNCRETRMGAEKWGVDSGKMLNMEALLASVSRGLPVNVAVDGPAAPYWEKGKELYYTRFGQLELSCANCHEDNYGNYIRADHLSQGQVNGFPTYRLKNTKLNGVQSRFKGCVRDTRAETFSPGSPEFIALELYVASRGNGLSVEGPSVRN